MFFVFLQASWRPVSLSSSSQDHLISIPNFDSTNKAQLAQIAHHNAHILRQIKGSHASPVTQYHNPFPVFPAGASTGNGGIVSGGKHFLVQTSNIVHHPVPPLKMDNLLTSSSNVAQTIVPHMGVAKHNFISGKPSFLGKASDLHSQYKFLNSIHTSTAKIPGLMKTVSMPNYQAIYSSTTNRIPIIRYDHFYYLNNYRS